MQGCVFLPLAMQSRRAGLGQAERKRESVGRGCRRDRGGEGWNGVNFSRERAG